MCRLLLNCFGACVPHAPYHAGYACFVVGVAAVKYGTTKVV